MTRQVLTQILGHLDNGAVTLSDIFGRETVLRVRESGDCGDIYIYMSQAAKDFWGVTRSVIDKIQKETNNNDGFVQSIAGLIYEEE